MSIDVGAIEKFLKIKNIKYVSSCSFIEDEDTLILNISISSLLNGVTTPRKIKNLKNSISEKFGIRVIDSVIQSQKLNTIQFGVTSIINEEIPSDGYDLSLIIQSEGDFYVYLKLKDPALNDKGAIIEEKIIKYFDILEIKSFIIEIIKDSKNPPTLLATLRSAKKLAPFFVGEIVKELELRGFDLPSEKWMDKQLDLIRKKGFIFRRKDGRYTLTYQGILVTPHAGNRNSSDVERVLYLAGKKW